MDGTGSARIVKRPALLSRRTPQRQLVWYHPGTAMSFLNEINGGTTQRERRLAPALAVAEELRRRIHEGVYRDQEWLPSERELAETLGVHRNSVRGAIEELGREGLLIVKPRCRPVVHNPQRSRSAATATRPRTSTSRLVALVMWSFNDADGATPQEQIFFGMSEVLADAGYHGVFLNLGSRFGSSDENAAQEAKLLTHALTNEFEGVVFYANAFDQNRTLMREVAHRMPLVFIDRLPRGVEADYVGIDNRDALYKLTEHIIDLGHERLAYLTGDEPINTVGDRLKGFRHAIWGRFGSSAPDTVISGTGIDAPWSAFDLIFHAPDDKRPTALLCVNDVEARNAATQLATFGISIPGDVSLTGFDNIVKTLPNGVELTTVEQPFRQMGEKAAQLLVRRMEDRTAPLSYVECKTTLLLRGSIGPHR